MADLTWPLHGGSERWPVTRGAAEHLADGEDTAVDLACALGTPVLSVQGGDVIRSGAMGLCGNGIDLGWDADGDRWQARYCHLAEIVRGSGAVEAGEVIGYAGSTGWSTGPHLHLVLWKNDERVDPEVCLSAPVAAAAPGDRVLRALDIIWGWATRLEDPAESSAEEQAEASRQVKAAVGAVKEEAGLQ